MNKDLKPGCRVSVDFVSESASSFSGNRINGNGIVDRAEDGYVFGRLDGGQTFMCMESDVVVINDINLNR